MNKLLIGLSAAALLAATPAWAQDTKTQPGSQAEQSSPSTDSRAQPPTGSTERGPSTGTTASDPTRMEDKSSAQAPASSDQATGPMYRASSLIGSSIVNASQESIGDINDLIIGSDGRVEAVIVGVGGFLGLGARHVALKMSELNFTTNENGSPVVSTAMTKAQLEELPEWQRPGEK
jgi:sporulation protein YlmC with PRC-barrel domain